MKKHKGKSVGLIPLVVFLLATGWISFVLASLIKAGGFSWTITFTTAKWN